MIACVARTMASIKAAPVGIASSAPPDTTRAGAKMKHAAISARNASALIAVVMFWNSAPTFTPNQCSTANAITMAIAIVLTYGVNRGHSRATYSPTTIATADVVDVFDSQSVHPMTNPG